MSWVGAEFKPRHSSDARLNRRVSVLVLHIRAIEERMATHGAALCLQEMSSRNLNGQGIDGLGSLNYGFEFRLLVHPIYVVTLRYEPSGLIDP